MLDCFSTWWDVVVSVHNMIFCTIIRADYKIFGVIFLLLYGNSMQDIAYFPFDVQF